MGDNAVKRQRCIINSLRELGAEEVQYDLEELPADLQAKYGQLRSAGLEAGLSEAQIDQVILQGRQAAKKIEAINLSGLLGPD